MNDFEQSPHPTNRDGFPTKGTRFPLFRKSKDAGGRPSKRKRPNIARQNPTAAPCSALRGNAQGELAKRTQIVTDEYYLALMQSAQEGEMTGKRIADLTIVDRLAFILHDSC